MDALAVAGATAAARQSRRSSERARMVKGFRRLVVRSLRESNAIAERFKRLRQFPRTGESEAGR
jgi:hypothetical protein